MRYYGIWYDFDDGLTFDDLLSGRPLPDNSDPEHYPGYNFDRKIAERCIMHDEPVPEDVGKRLLEYKAQQENKS